METYGTAILLNVKTTDGRELVLVTDYEDKTVSLVAVSSYSLSILAIRDYRKMLSRVRVAKTRKH
jgi:hypothetical protein